MSENAGKSDLVSRKNEVGYDLVQSGDGCKAPNSLSEPGLWNSGVSASSVSLSAGINARMITKRRGKVEVLARQDRSRR
ncbi:hypothetical protein SNOG_06006 [Parastagonospora nodorum SN15]|uniref:Uncharacterized protein n=1 Tax=Phaeosphaeria nodorum (strain SN15 / ATCC MYA-4574 / FGSC 10173) TaxID=321614 RepID=Q0UQF8_PHANO|nr:hypothetical protein SNOG_06006 [Parastagonospora nodorum SN15]EAT87070.1 hypothetical protein SNOG_06006 [Parastagonospora nodorum SN15]